MNNEFIVIAGIKKHKVFLQDGFYSPLAPTANLHKHNFAEIHVVANGSATFTIGEDLQLLHSGNLMIVPRGVFHCCVRKENGAIHTAFQIDCELNEFAIYHIGSDIILRFLQEIEECKGFCSKGQKLTNG